MMDGTNCASWTIGMYIYGWAYPGTKIITGIWDVAKIELAGCHPLSFWDEKWWHAIANQCHYFIIMGQMFWFAQP